MNVSFIYKVFAAYPDLFNIVFLEIPMYALNICVFH